MVKFLHPEITNYVTRSIRRNPLHWRNAVGRGYFLNTLLYLEALVTRTSLNILQGQKQQNQIMKFEIFQTGANFGLSTALQ